MKKRSNAVDVENNDNESNESQLLWKQIVLWLESHFYAVDIGGV